MSQIEQQSHMVAYAYTKLDVQRREIRLCTLLPGTFDEPVACNLNVVSLDDKPEYESLSYAWGAAIFNKGLVVKDSVDSIVQDLRARESNNDTIARGQPAPGLILDVTTNLYTAFRYLRKGDQTRVVRTSTFQCCHCFLGTVLNLKAILERLLTS